MSLIRRASVTRRRRLGVAVAALVFVLSGNVADAAAGTGAPALASSSSGVHLPADEAAHKQPNEWWYFSGHLWGIDPSGHLHRYGFEYVTFQFLGIAPQPVYIGNLAVTDLNRSGFHYAASEDSYPAPVLANGFALHTGTWTMTGSNGDDAVHAQLPGYGLNLRLHTTEPAALHGRHGVIPFGTFGTSKYYSWTSLLTTGTVLDHGTPVRVIGSSWMDHQWGRFDFASGGGWDWFSMQLVDGRQYMLYFLRDAAGNIVQTVGTRVDRDGAVHHLTASAFSERAVGTWTSPVTGITYSSGWRIKIPGGELCVTPAVRDQELDLRQIQGVAYWEGDVSIRGRLDGAPIAGVGYTEINPAGQP